MLCCRLLTFYKKIVQEYYQSVKRTVWILSVLDSWSGSKLFANVRKQNDSPLGEYRCLLVNFSVTRRFFGNSGGLSLPEVICTLPEVICTLPEVICTLLIFGALFGERSIFPVVFAAW